RFAQRIAAWLEAGLDTCALLLFPLLVLLPRGVAALVSAAGLCAAGLVLSASGIRLTRILAVAAMLLGCLLLWGIASACWSVNPMRSLVVAARLADGLASLPGTPGDRQGRPGDLGGRYYRGTVDLCPARAAAWCRRGGRQLQNFCWSPSAHLVVYRRSDRRAAAHRLGLGRVA